jgi:hypothetical protein
MLPTLRVGNIDLANSVNTAKSLYERSLEHFERHQSRPATPNVALGQRSNGTLDAFHVGHEQQRSTQQ